MKIFGEISCQSWPLLTQFFNCCIVQWWWWRWWWRWWQWLFGDIGGQWSGMMGTSGGSRGGCCHYVTHSIFIRSPCISLILKVYFSNISNHISSVSMNCIYQILTIHFLNLAIFIFEMLKWAQFVCPFRLRSSLFMAFWGFSMIENFPSWADRMTLF